MNPYYTISLVGFLVVLAVLLVRYVNRTVDEQFRSLARAADDGAFRRERIQRLTDLLSGVLPLPHGVPALPDPGTRLVPGAFLFLVLMVPGVVLLWGAAGGVAREERAPWLYGGLAALGAAALYMLLTLRRRRWAGTARLLLFRADLRRMDGDRAGSAADLRQLLILTPWDDSAWAELSDDLAVAGELGPALEAMERASSVDPLYDEYHMLRASLAIRLKDFPRARAAIESWRGAGRADADDPRLTVYQAALDLAEGRRDAAEAALRVVRLGGDGGSEFLDADQALEGVRGMVGGRN